MKAFLKVFAFAALATTSIASAQNSTLTIPADENDMARGVRTTEEQNSVCNVVIRDTVNALVNRPGNWVRIVQSSKNVYTRHCGTEYNFNQVVNTMVNERLSQR